MKYSSKLWGTLAMTVLLWNCGGKEEATEKVLRPVKFQEVGFLGGEKG